MFSSKRRRSSPPPRRRSRNPRSLARDTTAALSSADRRSVSASDQSAETEVDQPTLHCFVLLTGEEPLDTVLATAAAERLYGPDIDVRERDDEDDGADSEAAGTLFLTRGGQPIGFIGHIPAPIPGEEAEYHASGNALWPEGETEAARHDSHLIITVLDHEAGLDEEMTDGRELTAACLAVTRLAQVALRAAGDRAIGVYWGNGSITNSAPVFRELAAEAGPEHLPLHLWVRFQVYSEDEEAYGFYTIGMQQLGLMDLEVAPVQREPAELFEFGFDLAHYLALSGAVIADGDTVGGDADDRIRVFHRPSVLDRAGPVYHIAFGED